MSRMKVYVYTKESGVYTVFYVESENDFEIHYILRCIEISFRRFGYIIEAVQCQGYYISISSVNMLYFMTQILFPVSVTQ